MGYRIRPKALEGEERMRYNRDKKGFTNEPAPFLPFYFLSFFLRQSLLSRFSLRRTLLIASAIML